MAPLRNTATFNPFLSLDCARVEGVGRKERKGSNFAIWQPWHKGAKEVVEKHGGSLPRDVKGLRAIPGIGAYTAGAISSIAFQRREALVDGNVIRVMARLRGYAGDTKVDDF